MTKPHLLLALLLSGPAHAASFDCDAAKTPDKGPDETAICRTLSLNDRDVEMATRFEILKDVLPMGGRAKLREDQETWLAERRTCAADVACLKAIYDARLTVLRAVQSEFSKQGPQ